jgi:hypothetical protein
MFIGEPLPYSTKNVGEAMAESVAKREAKSGRIEDVRRENMKCSVGKSGYYYLSL